MNNLRIDKQNVTSFILNHIFEFLVIVMIITLSFTASGFLSTTNILGIFRNMALAGVIAYGMMMAIICGEIDLSVPSTVALTGIVIGLFCEYLPAYGIPEWLCVVLGILTMLIFAALIGTFINFLVYRFKMPAFVASMAVMYIIYGFAAVISNGFPVTTFPSWYNAIGAGLILGIPVPAIITLVMFGVTLFLLKYTKFGRSVYAIGGNSEAARLNGTNIVRTKRFVFIYVQICAVLSGIMASSQVMSGNFNFGKGWEFTAISCVVIGGTAFTGGKGRVWGTFVGLFFYGIITNAMTLLNINQYMQYIVRGALILIAVIINSYNPKHK